MKSLHLTVLLSFLAVFGKVKAQEPECIQYYPAFQENKWKMSGNVKYDENLRAFDVRGNSSLFKEAAEFIPVEPKNSAYLYIQYEAKIMSQDEAVFIFFPNKDQAEESLALNGSWVVPIIKIVELSKEAIGTKNVTINARNLGPFDTILVTKFGIWYGDGNPEEIQLAVETACGWLPPTTPTTTSTTTRQPETETTITTTIPSTSTTTLNPTTTISPSTPSHAYQPLTKVDCIDTLEEYDTNSAWTFPAGMENVSDSGDLWLFPKGGKDVFYWVGDGNGTRKTFSRQLNRASLSEGESFFLYLKHFSFIVGSDDEKITVVNADNEDLSQVLDPSPLSDWRHSLVKFTDKLNPVEVSIHVDKYAWMEHFAIDKIAVVSGKRDGRSDEEMIQEIDRMCISAPVDPTESTSSIFTSSTSSSSTSISSSSTTTSATKNPSNTTVSPIQTTTSAPTKPIVQVISTEEDFKKYEWVSSQQYRYAAEFSNLPSGITSNVKLSGKGIFYFEGRDTRAQITIQKHLTYGDFYSRPSYMYISYYTVLQTPSAENQNILVSPTETEPGHSLNFTSGNIWGEELVRLNLGEPQDQKKIQIIINGFRANDYFLLDEIYLVHGVEFKNVEEIKDFVDEYISENEGGENDGNDGESKGFGTPKLLLVTAIPALAVLVIFIVYFNRKRRQEELADPLYKY